MCFPESSAKATAEQQHEVQEARLREKPSHLPSTPIQSEPALSCKRPQSHPATTPPLWVCFHAPVSSTAGAPRWASPFKSSLRLRGSDQASLPDQLLPRQPSSRQRLQQINLLLTVHLDWINLELEAIMAIGRHWYSPNASRYPHLRRHRLRIDQIRLFQPRHKAE